MAHCLQTLYKSNHELVQLVTELRTDVKDLKKHNMDLERRLEQRWKSEEHGAPEPAAASPVGTAIGAEDGHACAAPLSDLGVGANPDTAGDPLFAAPANALPRSAAAAAVSRLFSPTLSDVRSGVAYDISGVKMNAFFIDIMGRYSGNVPPCKGKNDSGACGHH